MKTLVIGLGNPILTDDGVGVKIAYAIQKMLTFHNLPNVEVTEASVGGLRLMETMLDYDQVYLIDAIIPTDNTTIGTFRRLTINDLKNISPTQHSASAHDTTLITALDMAKSLGLSIPKKIAIYAINVQNVLEFGEKPTEEVSRCIPVVAQEIIDELTKDYQLLNEE